MALAARMPLTLDLSHTMSPPTQSKSSPDLTVYCRGKTYSVHRSILRARSDFFDGACRNPFRESQRGWIDLSEDDPEAVAHMIDYFYHLDYLPSRRVHHARASSMEWQQPQTPSLSSTPSSPLSPITPATPTFSPEPLPRSKLNLTMVEDPLLAIANDNLPKKTASPHLSRFGIHSPLVPADMPYLLAVKEADAPAPVIDTMIYEDADKSHDFDEESIPEQETDYFHANLVAHAKVYAIAEQYGIPGLKVLAKKKYAAQVTFHRETQEFASSLAEVYDGTVDSDRGLRDIVIRMFRQFPELAQRSDVELVVRETAPLAWELFRIAWGLPV